MQLLHRLSIRSINGSEKLLKVIKVPWSDRFFLVRYSPSLLQNPITDHLPINSHKISEQLWFADLTQPTALIFSAPSALSFDAKPVRLSKYLPTIPDTHSIVVFVGAMAHGYVGWCK